MLHAFHSCTRRVPGIGTLALRPFEPARHGAYAHQWLTHEHARFWGMQAYTPAATRRYFEAIEVATTQRAFIGLHEDTPMFLLEAYDPAAEPVGQHYQVAGTDLGMHILIAPPTRPVHLFTWAVFAFAVDTLLGLDGVERLVVEPDVDNTGIHVLNARAGFVYHRQIELDDKRAWLASCTAHDRQAARRQLTGAQLRVSEPMGDIA